VSAPPSDAPGARLRRLLERTEPLVVPGCADALTARLAQAAGFEALYATGAGIANSLLGRPDVADIDTGFGNAINAGRTARAFERAGVAAVQIEDQVFPKRCGHFAGTEVIPLDEMLGKLRAVLDARADPSLVVIARTDALAGHGFDVAVERALAFADAGADAIFVEAPTDRDQLAALASRIPAPLVANMVEGGRTPLLSSDELGAMGYRIVLFANAALRVAAAAVRDAFAELRRTGSTAGLVDRMLTWDERQALVGLDEIEALERRYAAPAGAPAATGGG
jgi:2-methylisocitrate lyase-like PEP mutase family enzyme